MTNDSHKARLAALVQELSVIHEKVILASGRESDFYVDMRRSTLHHEAAPLIGHVMLDLLEESGFSVGEEYVAVGGLTMGADPVATAMLHAAASRGLDLDAFVVRKAAKDHGMKRRIEGPDVVGKNVVVLEDTSTTGGSPLEAALALREAGGVAGALLQVGQHAQRLQIVVAAAGAFAQHAGVAGEQGGEVRRLFGARDPAAQRGLPVLLRAGPGGHRPGLILRSHTTRPGLGSARTWPRPRCRLRALTCGGRNAWRARSPSAGRASWRPWRPCRGWSG